MKLVKKLAKQKIKENQKKMLDECLINEEAIPTSNNLPEAMVDHPEGEYILKKDGIYLRYVVREEKSCGDNIKDDNQELKI